MHELPDGTVTFLFTDVEGSTRLPREVGAERYAEVLAEHRRVLRDAFHLIQIWTDSVPRAPAAGLTLVRVALPHPPSERDTPSGTRAPMK